MTIHWYDMDGEVITTAEHIRRYPSAAERTVAYTVIELFDRAQPGDGVTPHEADQANEVLNSVIEGVTVSTVLLGLDHSYGAPGPPVIFETMVFGGPVDEMCDRYRTKEEAQAGHEAMVARVRELLGRK